VIVEKPRFTINMQAVVEILVEFQFKPCVNFCRPMDQAKIQERLKKKFGKVQRTGGKGSARKVQRKPPRRNVRQVFVTVSVNDWH